jgi:hypothetical protein
MCGAGFRRLTGLRSADVDKNKYKSSNQYHHKDLCDHCCSGGILLKRPEFHCEDFDTKNAQDNVKGV